MAVEATFTMRAGALRLSVSSRRIVSRKGQLEAVDARLPVIGEQPGVVDQHAETRELPA